MRLTSSPMLMSLLERLGCLSLNSPKRNAGGMPAPPYTQIHTEIQYTYKYTNIYTLKYTEKRKQHMYTQTVTKVPSTIQYILLKFTFLYYSAEVLCLLFSLICIHFYYIVYGSTTMTSQFQEALGTSLAQWYFSKVAGVKWVFFSGHITVANNAE